MPTSLLTRLERTGVSPRRHPNVVFKFKVNQDAMSRMYYVQANLGDRAIGHFDFTVESRIMHVQYGAFSTSEAESYGDWAYSCLKSLAIEVNQEFRNRFRGIGSAMVTAALHWGKQQGLLGMKITKPRTPALWLKLNFSWEGADLIFRFGEHRLPKIMIREKGSPINAGA